MKSKYQSLISVCIITVASGCHPIEEIKNSQDDTLVMVKIVSVKTQQEYNAMPDFHAGQYPNTVVERLDTKERIMIPRDNWGKVGDEFAIKVSNLRWK